MEMPKYEVLTAKSDLDIEYINEAQYWSDFTQNTVEKYKILKRELSHEYYKLHFLPSRYAMEATMYTRGVDSILDFTEYLAIKEGCDLVRFENGKLGFVAYCNGNENGFVISTCTREEWEENA